MDNKRPQARQIMMKARHGFTMIELLLVMAIIAILAAIGIPQLAQYKIRVYNASALTDIQTARIAEQSVFADKQQYASTAGTGCTGDPICTGTFGFGVAGVVDIVLRPGGALEANGTPSSYTAATKNIRGDRVYCTDSDLSFIRYATDVVNAPLGMPYRAPTANQNVDDCAANFPFIQ